MKILRVIAALYIMSGLWCSINSEIAGIYVGYTMSNSLMMAEFFTVYGGLQLGLGLAMMIGSFKHAYQEGTLFFSMVFGVTLFVARLVSLAIYPEALEHQGVWFMTKLELFIAAALVFAYVRVTRTESASRIQAQNLST